MNQSRGFVGRRGGASVTLPPGQYLTRDFPVLSAIPTPQLSLDTLLEDLVDDASFVLARSYGGYTTNVPVEDLMSGRAWIAFRFDGEDLEPEHGGPARLLVPHLYFWKSAKWVNGITLLNHDEPGFWETRGYHIYGDPWREQRYSGD